MCLSQAFYCVNQNDKKIVMKQSFEKQAAKKQKTN